MEPKREFTIKLQFGAQAKNPNNAEIFKFFNKQEWTSEDLSAMYRDDHCVFVRFKTEAMMRGAMTKMGPQVMFDYEDGTSLEVPVTAAAGTFKYVRIFGLPPEVDDKFIAAAMAKYGKVQQLVRERFPAETGFPIWNGVRGVHIELVSEIPAQLTIQHCKARIYYDGLQNKCFGCGALDHLKAACPNRKSVNTRLTASAAQTSGSFASVVAKGVTAKDAAQPSTSGMVVLTPATAPVRRRSIETSNQANVSQTQPDVDKSSQQSSTAPADLQTSPAEAVEDDVDHEDNEDQQNDGELLENKGEPMETQGAWKEAKGKGKRGRPRKPADSDSSESDARGGKQFIVPAQEPDLLGAQALRERSRTRSASLQRIPNNK